MRYWFMRSVCLGLLLCWIAAPVMAADVAKIGIVDFKRVLASSAAGKAAQAEINAKGKQMEGELKSKADGIQALRKDLELKALALDDDTRNEKERQIRIQLNDLKVAEKQYSKEFKRFERGLVQQIQKEVIAIVEEIGKKEGFLMIVELREAGLMYFPTNIDITDKVIHEYNQRFAQKEN
jgi:outer membrane protein